MSDPVIPLPEPDLSSDAAFADRVREDIAAVTDLAAAGVEVDGEVRVTGSTWVVYGHSSYDGETIVGVYHDEMEASEVVHLAPHPFAPDENGPGS